MDQHSKLSFHSCIVKVEVFRYVNQQSLILIGFRDIKIQSSQEEKDFCDTLYTKGVSEFCPNDGVCVSYEEVSYLCIVLLCLILETPCGSTYITWGVVHWNVAFLILIIILLVLYYLIVISLYPELYTRYHTPWSAISGLQLRIQ